MFINERVCEGCGDCSVQSNCLSIEPLATPFGTKRQINQSTCNNDYSCAKGFCPSFVVVEGAEAKRGSAEPRWITAAAAELAAHPPRLPETGHDVLLTGIGGTGVTTVTAVLAMAGHIDGLEVATLDVTGLAQKGGAVTSHLRLAPAGRRIAGGRIATGQADVLLAGDLVVAAGRESLGLCDPARTVAIADAAIAPTAEFTLKQTESYREARLESRVAKAVRELSSHDLTDLARRLFGDVIYANMILVGAAHQKGLLPVSLEAVEQAIRLNGVAVEQNLAAFCAGRLLIGRPEALGFVGPEPKAPEREALDDLIGRLAFELIAYQDRAYAARYRRLVQRVRAAERGGAAGGERLTRAVATSFFKLMAYKDEYEVARLYGDPAFTGRLKETFEGRVRLSVQLAPPLLARTDPATGRPRKMTFGRWIFTAFRLLRRMKLLRGTALDPFGYSAERRTERRLISDYEQTIERVLADLSPYTYDLAVEIARIPERIRGFGPIKTDSLREAKKAETVLLARFEEQSRAEIREPAFLLAAE
jgi:indolepyruvate ferredoxin oxidoreductase